MHLTIASVEDNPVSMRILCALIVRAARLLGITVQIDSISYVHQAIHLIETKKYDIIFLDLKLPDGEGEDIAIHARKSVLNPESIIVAMTAYERMDGEIALRERDASQLQYALEIPLYDLNSHQRTLAKLHLFEYSFDKPITISQVREVISSAMSKSTQ